MKSPATKRTVYIDGRKTGVSLEDAFWSCLNEIAQAQGVTVSQTVTEIEKSRQGETCPPRSACSYSTGPVQKTWVPPQGNTAAPISAASFRREDTLQKSSRIRTLSNFCRVADNSHHHSRDHHHKRNTVPRHRRNHHHVGTLPSRNHRHSRDHHHRGTATVVGTTTIVGATTIVGTTTISVIGSPP